MVEAQLVAQARGETELLTPVVVEVLEFGMGAQRVMVAQA